MRSRSKLLGMAATLFLAASVPLCASAQRYDIANGSVTITVDAAGTQTVTQAGQSEVQTGETVLTGTASSETAGESHTIVITTADSAAAKLTLENIALKTGGVAAIDVQGTSAAHITYRGENTIEGGTIHVTAGDLTIADDGDRATSDSLYVHSDRSGSAAIGTNEWEDFTGKLTLTGAGKMDVSNASGAAIGTGGGAEIAQNAKLTIDISGELTALSGVEKVYRSEEQKYSYIGYSCIGVGQGLKSMRGEMNIRVHDGGTLRANITEAGTAIGSHGSLDGTLNITVGEGSELYASGVPTGEEYEENTLRGGVAIGANGSTGGLAGTIRIDVAKGGTLEATGGNSAGIGAGSSVDFASSGRIEITGDGDIYAVGGARAAGIGTSMAGTVTAVDGVTKFEPSSRGTIYIATGGELRAEGGYGCPGIGTGGYENEMDGAIVIEPTGGHVIATGKGNSPGIGVGENGTITSAGSITIGGTGEVQAISGTQKAASIGCGYQMSNVKNAGLFDGMIRICAGANVLLQTSGGAAGYLGSGMGQNGVSVGGLKVSAGSSYRGNGSSAQYIVEPGAVINGTSVTDAASYAAFLRS